MEGLSAYEVLSLLLQLVTACASVTAAACCLCVYLRTKGVDLKAVEMDLFALWQRKANGSKTVPRGMR